MKKEIFILIIVFLCGISGFCIYRYLRINTKLNNKISEVAKLEDENLSIIKKLEIQIAEGKQLIRDKKALEEEIDINKQKLTQLKQELLISRQDIVGLKRVSGQLDKDNQQLRDEYANLAAKIDILSQERNSFLEKLSSLEGLKQAIKDLKRKKRTGSISKITDDSSNDNVASGNRGYLVYRGESTYRPQFSIQVMPAE